MLSSTVIVMTVSTITLALSTLNVRQLCGQMYELCSPQGATASELPPVGSELSNLYSDLVKTVSMEIPTSLKSPSKGQASDGGNDTGAFCYFYFPDGSYGTLVTGNYTSALAVQVNLIYGDWKSQDGMTGNIYSNAPSNMPDTSTMPMPTPWTSSGVGSAIPASELGSSTMLNETTTNSPSTTISAITLLSTTVTIGTSECRHCNFTIISGPTGWPATDTDTATDTGTVITTTLTSGPNGSGLPSASSSIYTVTTVFPPINKATSLTMPVYSCLLITIANIITCIFPI